MEYILLLIGFVLLIKGADFFVDGASSVATRFKIPPLVIGLTVVSLGTSAPEAAISISAAMSGSASISLGNVVGSNMFNLLMVIGVSSAMLPMVTDDSVLKRDMPVNMAATALLCLMIIDGELGRAEALILCAAFVFYLYVIVKNALAHPAPVNEKTKSRHPLIALAFIAGGLFGIIRGGDLVVENAKVIAASFGMSETMIGLTIVAIGTSLPELVTSVVAARKGESGIAMGNAVGSCLFNSLFILGTTGVISPLSADSDLVFDFFLLAIVCVILFIFAARSKSVGRAEGIACIAIYAAYTVFIILRAYGIIVI